MQTLIYPACYYTIETMKHAFIIGAVIAVLALALALQYVSNAVIRWPWMPPEEKPFGVGIDFVRTSGLEVNVTIAITGGEAPFTVFYDFGDNTTITKSVSTSSAYATHVYSNAGTYVITVTAVGADGKAATTQKSITV